jgi:hypothetical protein
MRKTTLSTKLDKLAERILDDLAADKDASLDQRIDVLKVVGAYHLGLTRVSGKNPADDDRGGPSFREWGERLKQERPDA